jgi:hypothetical protein
MGLTKDCFFPAVSLTILYSRILDFLWIWIWSHFKKGFNPCIKGSVGVVWWKNPRFFENLLSGGPFNQCNVLYSKMRKLTNGVAVEFQTEGVVVLLFIVLLYFRIQKLVMVLLLTVLLYFRMQELVVVLLLTALLYFRMQELVVVLLLIVLLYFRMQELVVVLLLTVLLYFRMQELVMVLLLTALFISECRSCW